MSYSGDIPTALAVLRIIRGLNQRDLAAASGCPSSAICEYERGRKEPELRTLETLLGAMSYTLADLATVRALVRVLRGERPADAAEDRLRGEVVGAALRLASGLLLLAGPPK